MVRGHVIDALSEIITRYASSEITGIPRSGNGSLKLMRARALTAAGAFLPAP